jgi:hypothetical protein
VKDLSFLFGTRNDRLRSRGHLAYLFVSCTPICERGFSKQNLIKIHLRTSLKLETLDALMRISCANIPVENITWNAVMLIWRNMKDRRIHPLL